MDFDLTAYAQTCRVADPERFVGLMRQFQELLKAANAKYNLTRIVESPEFEVKHVADSLALLREFPDLAESPLALADVGCGAGFPSVVLAAARPNLALTAIDSTGKKTAFVAEAARTLGLANLQVVTGRAVELNRKAEFQHRFDVVTARAVATVDKLARECSKFLKPGGRFIFYKTPGQAEEELPQLNSGKLKWRATRIYELPLQAGGRCFLTSRN